MSIGLTEELRKASTAVFLATEEDVARDLSDILIQAADKIDSLRKVIFLQDNFISTRLK